MNSMNMAYKTRLIDISVREVGDCEFDYDYGEMDLNMIMWKKHKIDCEVVENN